MRAKTAIRDEPSYGRAWSIIATSHYLYRRMLG